MKKIVLTLVSLMFMLPLMFSSAGAVPIDGGPGSCWRCRGIWAYMPTATCCESASGPSYSNGSSCLSTIMCQTYDRRTGQCTSFMCTSCSTYGECAG